jgi:hypothetical protein
VARIVLSTVALDASRLCQALTPTNPMCSSVLGTVSHLKHAIVISCAISCFTLLYSVKLWIKTYARVSASLSPKLTASVLLLVWNLKSKRGCRQLLLSSARCVRNCSAHPWAEPLLRMLVTADYHSGSA